MFSDNNLEFGAGIYDGQSQTRGVERTQMIPRVQTTAYTAAVKLNGTHIVYHHIWNYGYLLACKTFIH